MKWNIKEIIYMLLVFVLSFVTSFYALGGVYFVLAVPVVILAMNYKSSYLFIGFSAMLLASFFVDPVALPVVLFLCFLLAYVFAFFIRKVDIPLKTYLSIVASFFGFLISIGQYLYMKEVSIINIIIVPMVSYFICYHFIEIQFDFKSKEKFSITKKQLMFFSIVGNMILGLNFSTMWIFDINFVSFVILNFILLKIDKYAGLLGVLVGFIFSTQYTNIAILFLIPAIFAIRSVEKKYYYGVFTYLMINIGFFAFFNRYDYLLEVLVITAFMFTFPRNLFTHIHKYIIDPQDYELKLYQQSYYKTLNHNKKIQKVMGILEEHMKNVPNSKRSTKKIILGDLEFLREKLNQEDDIHLKDNILNELEYKNANILTFKIHSDFLDNYVIYLENRHSKVDCKSMMNVIEDFLGVKLKLKKYKYNQLLAIESYVFVNDEKLKFNINIKQRSKENGCCGDSYLSFNIKNKKYVLISDGMGHGEKASKDSSSSLFMLKSFIELGMEPSQAIVSCNAFILDKEKENFNTLDLLEYNVFDNTINLYKNGSGPTYLKNKGSVTKLNSENLPLGIVDNIKVDKINIDTNLDYIILTSDGIKKELTEVIGQSKSKNAKSLTNDIFNYEGEKIEDDQTIVAINVIKRR